MKVHYPKLYNMAHLLALNVLLLLKDLNNYFYFLLLQLVLYRVTTLKVHRTSSIVQVIFLFGPLRSARIFCEIRNSLSVKIHFLYFLNNV